MASVFNNMTGYLAISIFLALVLLDVTGCSGIFWGALYCFDLSSAKTPFFHDVSFRLVFILGESSSPSLLLIGLCRLRAVPIVRS